jgi:hypothetical protein
MLKQCIHTTVGQNYPEDDSAQRTGWLSWSAYCASGRCRPALHRALRPGAIVLLVTVVLFGQARS